MDFPAYRMPMLPILTPYNSESLGLGMAGNTFAGNGVSVAWAVANKALFYPFTCTDWVTVYQLLWFVGATSAGNIDVGIYDSQKNRVVSAGTTAMSATVGTVHELNVTDTLLAPGVYLLAGVCSSITGTVNGLFIQDESQMPAMPIYEQATALPLPDPCVPVMCTDNAPILALIGAQLRASPF